MHESTERHEPVIVSVQSKGRVFGYERLEVATSRGRIDTRLYQAPGAESAAVLVGGVGGGYDSPAKDLYTQLGTSLPASGVSVLRICYRNSTDLEGSIHDVLAGIRLLETHGVRRVGLVGHSFGGAVVISAGTLAPEVACVVTLATQAYGTDAVGQLSPRPLLLLHGVEDEVLPPGCSSLTYKRAREPKELRLLEGAHHGLDEAAEEVYRAVSEWLTRGLGGQPQAEG